MNNKELIESLRDKLDKAEGALRDLELAYNEREDEIELLKQKIGGYQTSNENYRKRIVSLTDELVSVKRALSEEIKKNEDFDAKNHEQTNQFYRDKEQSRAKITELETQCELTSKKLAESNKKLAEILSMPWYKRIFAK